MIITLLVLITISLFGFFSLFEIVSPPEPLLLLPPLKYGETEGWTSEAGVSDCWWVLAERKLVILNPPPPAHPPPTRACLLPEELGAVSKSVKTPFQAGFQMQSPGKINKEGSVGPK